MTASYTPLFAETDFRTAIDRVLSQAQHELLVFDRDLTPLRLEEHHRIKLLADFLTKSPIRSIRIVVHDPDTVERSSPHLMQLIAHHSHTITCRQTPDNLRQLADGHLIADKNNGVRRFQFDQPRSALILEDANYLQPWRQRFEDLWQSSSSCLLPTTTGL